MESGETYIITTYGGEGNHKRLPLSLTEISRSLHGQACLREVPKPKNTLSTVRNVVAMCTMNDGTTFKLFYFKFISTMVVVSFIAPRHLNKIV